jgi:hypothetical protein
MGRAIPLPPLQGHEACNRVNFTFTFYYLLHSSENGKRNSTHTVTNCITQENVTDAVNTAAEARINL